MVPHVQLTRAIGSEFMARKLAGIRLLFVIVSVIALLVSIWLVSQSLWWLLLAVPVALLTIIGTLLLLLGRLLVRLARPHCTPVQTKGVSDFVDKLERVAETVQTPAFIIAFYVMRDVIRTPEKTYIESITGDSTSLRPDFIALQKLFT